MSYLFKDATVAALDPITVERGDVRVEAGLVVERAADLTARPGDEVFNLGGKLVMPGMVCAHTHLYSALARGMPAPPRAPRNFREILELVWWRLDRALDAETIYWSAIAGALDAARTGTTCLFDHHASPSHIRGSLQIVREAMEQVGLRGVLCYEVTDRGGLDRRELGLKENGDFLGWVAASQASNPDHSMFRGLVGAHASFTLSDDALRAAAELMRGYGVGLHIHAAEDKCDIDDARSRFGKGVVERLVDLGAINDQTILAHGVHLDASDIARALEAGAWLVHNPRSNMNNQIGYAPVVRFGERMLLGTDGIGADMFEEARFAFFKGRDEHTAFGADRWVNALANNQRLASKYFGVELGALVPGAAADLVVLDYDAPTPVTSENLAWHFAFGVTSAAVESVMVGGRFVVKGRQFTFDAKQLQAHARKAAERLWDRMQHAG